MSTVRIVTRVAKKHDMNTTVNIKQKIENGNFQINNMESERSDKGTKKCKDKES